MGLLAGLPIGVKDLQATAGLRTTLGSLLYKDNVPAEDEFSVANIRRAGGVILGKTNTPEFGAGANTTNRVYGPTGNPFDPAKTCAGSSGGSAVALALGQVPLATGSDLGGSLRTPASFCGVARFSALARGCPVCRSRAASLSPFSVSGPMGRTVADMHLLLRAQMGQDKRDPFSSADNARIPARLTGADLGCSASPSRPTSAARRSIRPSPRSSGRACAFSPAFREVQERAPDFGPVHDVFEMRCVQFVAAHRERLEKSRELLDRNVIDNTERGMKLSLADVSRAHVEQTKIYKRFLAFFKEVDVLICPAASVSPFPHAQLFVEEINGERMPTYMRWLAITYAPTMALAARWRCRAASTISGHAVRHPGHRPQGQDARVLEVAHALEQVLAERQGDGAARAGYQLPLPACVHAEHGFAMTRGSG